LQYKKGREDWKGKGNRERKEICLTTNKCKVKEEFKVALVSLHSTYEVDLSKIVEETLKIIVR